MAGKLRSPRRTVDPVRRGRAAASIGRDGQDRQQKAEGHETKGRLTRGLTRGAIENKEDERRGGKRERGGKR
jgi:hypothetical protein